MLDPGDTKVAVGSTTESKAGEAQEQSSSAAGGSKAAETKHDPRLVIVMMGHVDTGKTTIAGRLVMESLDQKVKDEHQRNREAKSKFLHSAAVPREYAGLCGERPLFRYERERGITIDISIHALPLGNRQATIVDGPGHRDFLHNLVSGIRLADVGVLVVAAGTGEFEAGYARHGQTRDHALLAFTQGVKSLIVVVNKMDDKTVNYSQSRFNEIRDEVATLLIKIGYKPLAQVGSTKNFLIPFIPVSGYLGENIGTTRSSKMSWYTGPTLLEALQACEAPKLPSPSEALRFGVCSRPLYSKRLGGVIVIGRVESGTLQVGQRVCLAPTPLHPEVKSIQQHSEERKEALSGDVVGVLLVGAGIDAKSVRSMHRGMWLGESAEGKAVLAQPLPSDSKPGAQRPPVTGSPARVISMEAQLIVLNCPSRIRLGYSPTIDLNYGCAPVVLRRILGHVDKRTGNHVPSGLRFIKHGEAAIVELVPYPVVPAERPTSAPAGKQAFKGLAGVEPFAMGARFGRIVIRDSRTIVGVAVLKSVLLQHVDSKGVVTVEWRGVQFEPGPEPFQEGKDAKDAKEGKDGKDAGASKERKG